MLKTLALVSNGHNGETLCMDENTVLVKEQGRTEAIAFLQITDSARDISDIEIRLRCPGNGAGKAKGMHGNKDVF